MGLYQVVLPVGQDALRELDAVVGKLGYYLRVEDVERGEVELGCILLEVEFLVVFGFFSWEGHDVAIAVFLNTKHSLRLIRTIAV